jgi:hypothetical protein
LLAKICTAFYMRRRIVSCALTSCWAQLQIAPSSACGRHRAEVLTQPFVTQPKALASVYCLSRGVASAGKTALQMATVPIPAGTSGASGTWTATAAAGTAAVTVAGPARSRICPANAGVRATAAGAGGAAGTVCCAARASCDNKAADVFYVQTGEPTASRVKHRHTESTAPDIHAASHGCICIVGGDRALLKRTPFLNVSFAMHLQIWRSPGCQTCAA